MQSLPASLRLDQTAFFFDFDGTLVELAPTPDAVRVLPRVPQALAALARASGGAVAVVSGREIASIDAMLGALRLPLAGLHGAERRAADGALTRSGFDNARLAEVVQALQGTVDANRGMLLEIKGAAVALHYRNAPQREAVARAAAQAAVAAHGDKYALQPGKMVFEIKPRDVDKGRAIQAFMTEAPFAGRVPVFAGDDLTDEKGFAVVNAMHGISIKVGEGATIAGARLASVGAVIDWMSGLAGASMLPGLP
jgi:trehalose 6-phosphate phosphatase